MAFTNDPWSFLKKFTHARIALGRAGHGAPTKEILNFRLAHSKARDSVWSEVDFTNLSQNLDSIEQGHIGVKSNCQSKQDFLLNPNQGRELDATSHELLKSVAGKECDVALIIADGLSASAVHLNAWEFTRDFLELIKKSNLTLGPVVLAKYARVGLGDLIGQTMTAKSTVVLIGERPGLATAESLSVYYTYHPSSQNTDANRNCISNIHAAGLSPSGAAMMTEYLIKSSFQLKLSGVDLKVEYPALLQK